MRNRKRPAEVVANFDITVSDLMAAILQLFVLVLMAVMLNVNQYRTATQATVQDAKAVSEQLFQALMHEFGPDLKRWNATIDPQQLSFSFQSPDTLFQPNSGVLLPRFKEILDDFFPRFISVLRRPQFIAMIEEIRIEGHTAPEVGKDPEVDYLEGIQLSQSRTSKVLTYCVVETIGTDEYKDWVRPRTVANGYSNSHPKMVDGEVDLNLSRRVEFRVRTNLQKVLDHLIKLGETKP